jgi:hypothetical protein
MIRFSSIALALLLPLPLFAQRKTPDPDITKTPPGVYAVGVYEGTYPPGIRHAGGFHPPGHVTVKVPFGRRPAILILTAYEPVIWKIEAPKGALARVIASGYHRQQVEGLTEKVPVTRISYKAKDRDYFYAYRKAAGPKANQHERGETKRKYDRLVERVKALTGKDITSFRGSYAGKSFDLR